MMKFNLLILILFTLTGCEKENSKNYLTGTVTDPEIKSILLKGIDQDFRFDSIIEIPVVKGQFDYEFNLDQPIAYELMLGSARENGGGHTTTIFLHDSDVKLTVHGEDNFAKNEVIGGALNKEYSDFQKHVDSVEAQNPNFRFADKLALGDSFMEKNSSVVSYYLLLSNLIHFQDIVDLEKAKKIYYRLSKANEQHPYNELAKNILTAWEHVKIGNDFIDFSAPDINGTEFKFSDQLKGKIVLLNLWATWCGPCIEKSRKAVPIYEQFKDKGFTMVNVAGEFKDTNRLKDFFEKEKWPGTNLVELDRKNSIWLKYGVGNGGGKMFLIDQKGKIIAVDPTPEELKNELAKRLIQ